MISVALLRISTLKTGRTRQSQLQAASEQKQKVHGCVTPLPQRVASVYTVHTAYRERQQAKRNAHTQTEERNQNILSSIINPVPQGKTHIRNIKS